MHRTVHFTMTGEFITNIAREKLFVEKDLGSAIRILRSGLVSDQLDSNEQLMLCLMVLHGAASVIGSTADGSYGIKVRDDLDERPTNLSAIATLISDMNSELTHLRKQNEKLTSQLCFLAEQIPSYRLNSINEEYEEETGEKMFPGMRDDREIDSLLNSFLEQRRREDEMEEYECDYGWLEPNGTWHPVEWCKHSEWAQNWLDEHMPFAEHPEIYWYEDPDGDRHHIYDIDVMIQSLNWVLMDSPYQGIAHMRRNMSKNLTKAQKSFLYDYFMKQNRKEEAAALYEEQP